LAFQVAKMVKDYLKYDQIDENIILIDIQPLSEEVSHADTRRSFESREELVRCT
jgi:hypothetical protein